MTTISEEEEEFWLIEGTDQVTDIYGLLVTGDIVLVLEEMFG